MSRAVRTLLLLALVGAAPQAAAGRNQIVGWVLDRNGEPVHRAIVTLVPGNVQMMTTREGGFLIDYLRDEQGERIRLKKRTDYVLEVFKPGFHPQNVAIAYRRGTVELPTITLIEETISVEAVEGPLQPDPEATTSHSAGAAYEGQ